MKIKTAIPSIREKCKDCCCGQLSEIRNCEITSCAIWPYRMGKRPSPADIKLLESLEKEGAS